MDEATEITENEIEIKEDSAIEADKEEIAVDTALSENKEAGAQQVKLVDRIGSEYPLYI